MLSVGQIRELINPENFKPEKPGKYKKSDDGYRFCVATALYAFAGMRASEIRALQWQDVDLAARRIHINRAFKSKRHILGLPKNGKVRDTVIPEILAPYLSGPKGSELWVTGLSDQRPMGYHKWHDVFQRVTVARGTPTTLHMLRHALNTSLMEKNANLAELIKAAFGWTSKGRPREGNKFGSDIQETYTHRETYDLSPLAKAIDDLFSQEAKKE
jgi:integrase